MPRGRPGSGSDTPPRAPLAVYRMPGRPVIPYLGRQLSFSGLDVYATVLPLAIATSKSNLRLAIDGDVYLTGQVISLSDARVKRGIETIRDPLARIRLLRGCTYHMAGPGARRTGLLAQDVLRAIPEAVYEGCDGTLSIAYDSLSGLIVESIKHLAEGQDRMRREEAARGARRGGGAG